RHQVRPQPGRRFVLLSLGPTGRGLTLLHHGAVGDGPGRDLVRREAMAQIRVAQEELEPGALVESTVVFPYSLAQGRPGRRVRGDDGRGDRWLPRGHVGGRSGLSPQQAARAQEGADDTEAKDAQAEGTEPKGKRGYEGHETLSKLRAGLRGFGAGEGHSAGCPADRSGNGASLAPRSEEHTSELQSRE